MGACSAMRIEGSGGGSSEFTDIMHAYRLNYNVGRDHYDCFVTVHSVSSTLSVSVPQYRQCHIVQRYSTLAESFCTFDAPCATRRTSTG